MSYCRWSSLNGYCDVYVYEDATGLGWITRVRSARMPVLGMSVPSEEAVWHEWVTANPPEAIDHDEAGQLFQHATPGECADNLERLARQGFIVPGFAIDDLRAEQKEMNNQPKG